MSARKPSEAQIRVLAWAIYRAGGFMRSIDWGYLGFTDATVGSLRRFGWADQVKFYDDAREWRWSWFRVTDAGRALPEVVAEVERLRSANGERAARNIAEDDADLGATGTGREAVSAREPNEALFAVGDVVLDPGGDWPTVPAVVVEMQGRGLVAVWAHGERIGGPGLLRCLTHREPRARVPVTPGMLGNRGWNREQAVKAALRRAGIAVTGTGREAVKR